jgi:hypothetical protein
MRCEGFIEFGMSKTNLRFMAVQFTGYWNDVLNPKTVGKEFRGEEFGEGANTPYMEIGKCSKI